ncbi:hypothetical protein AMJ57_00905 [Parcubacteria bacterium SG8_24]|nr:MAG: hypothetical protein AMJ57_00905 [Parcubacteria bacterium SG8_24]
MDIFSGTILGVIQGLTEFLPISSSGHLIVAREAFGMGTEQGLAVDAVLQLATILAVLIYFRSDLHRLLRSAVRLVLRRPTEPEARTMLAAIIVGTLPAMILGLLLEDQMETVFRSSRLVAVTLIAGSAVMLLGERFARQDRRLSAKRGLIVGLFQSLALVPGVSRSGATISGGLLVGLRRDRAARFSFLLAFPIIAGSGLLKGVELYTVGDAGVWGWPLFTGFLASFGIGLVSIHFLLRFLRHHSLAVFVVYRLVLAGVIMSGII